MKRTLAIISFLLLICVGLGQQLTPEQRDKLFEKVKQTIGARAYLPNTSAEDLNKKLDAARATIVAAETEPEFVRRVNEVLRAQGFSHIRFNGREATKRRRTGKASGFGADVRVQGESAEITYVYPGSNADKLALRPGDKLIGMDGGPFSRQKLTQGDVGSGFSLRYLGADGREHSRRVIREEYSSRKPAEGRMLDAQTGYIRLYSFQRYNNEEVRKAFQTVHQAPRLIVDIRSNGGGEVNAMRDFLSYFLPKGTVLGTNSRREADGKMVDRKMSVARDNPLRYTGKVALLVDRGSASASEITAAALQENKRATLVGRRTAGAVLVSTFAQLDEGFSLQHPISDYKTAKGVRLEKTGVTPDIEMGLADVRIAGPGEVDKAVQAALAYFRKSE